MDDDDEHAAVSGMIGKENRSTQSLSTTNPT
jgi:hypothetical protein